LAGLFVFNDWRGKAVDVAAFFSSQASDCFQIGAAQRDLFGFVQFTLQATHKQRC
jgi:hypothetical protein